MPLLEIKGLSKSFGGLTALAEFSINIENQELVGLIGPNGAGKTTAFNLLTGVYRPDKGTIMLNSTNLVGKKPYAICKAGVARTFQNIRLFNDLTVLENVQISFHKDVEYGIFSAIMRAPSYFRGEEKIRNEAMKYLEIFGLQDKAGETARACPIGEQRRLEISPGHGYQPAAPGYWTSRRPG
jgi:branched-chain amino acid transport system ATP-binding protein